MRRFGAAALFLVCCTWASGQIDNTRRTTLRGQIHAQARAEYDQGRVAPSLVLTGVTLALAQSEAQAAALDQLLAEQQTPGSPNYHRWLTPEEFAQRFGVSDVDLGQITAWLESQGLTIAAVARGRNWISVNGTAAQFEKAFQTEFHHYAVDGEMHFANATNPSVPAALAGVIVAIRGLNDFRLKPSARASPRNTSAKGNHYLAPDDLATIYNIKPLYAAGIDGSGQRLVIAGQTQIDLSDLAQFRSSYNLPASDPEVVLVPNSRDPGISATDLSEADMDLEWSGAVARNAALVYVYAYDVMQAVQYAIDQNLAPVVSTSYGMCEQSMGAEAQTLRSWAKQANAQGVTWFSASGDAGGADCNSYRAAGLAVDAPASIPEVTGVGGTEFKEGTGHFWNSANDGNGASVLSYIPEVVWNDSAADGEPAASGGGASTLFTKPAWQTGPGVPNDNARHVPDVALTASADHDGYLVYTSGSLQVFGGTSAPTPAFAGIGALLNQFVVASGAQSTPGLSNINPKLYALAETAPQVFHDISTGNNIVTVNCPARSRGCATAPVGYSAGAGYDQATGLGSIDAYRLVAAWNGGATSPSLLPTTAPVINELVNSASSAAVFAPGMVLTVYGLRLAPSVQAASSLPLPDSIAGVSATVNGVAAPLLYVSPEQLNVQIPYETAVGAAQFILTSGDQTTSMSIDVAAAAPGIFTDSSGAVLPLGSASRGQVVTLFVTGAGAVLPNIATGTAPSPSASTADLPKPVQGTTVTVGGVPADVQFIGIAPGLVGVVQIDCLVPDAAPLGPQPVVVAIGGIASAPATLNIPN